MPLKKQPNEANEIAIYDEALIYQRGEYWQMRMWLAKEKKYARFSLRTRNRDTAEAKAKKQYHELMAQQLAGKTYFSMTAKQAVDEYLKQRTKDMEAGLIVKGRLSTIKTHLEHWLKFIGKDTKVKEMERTDCENYFHNRTKNKKKLPVSRTTVLNEQSSINAMMSWLHKRGESYIEAFEFKKLGKIDTGVLAQIGNVQLTEITKHIKDKDFTAIRKWVASTDLDSNTMFRQLYDSLYEIMKPQSIPQAVVIIADYQYKNAFVADTEINLVACLTELMEECEFV